MSNKRIKGVSIYRPVIYGNSSTLLKPEERKEADHTHRWTIAVRSPVSPTHLPHSSNHWVGGKDDIGYFVKKVTFKLHETYANPLRSIEEPPFEVTETGWGEFDIIIKIFFHPEASEKPITLNHHLKLHPWPPTIPPIEGVPAPTPSLSPIHSWQYEEIVFVEPLETFYATLLAHPPSPLPLANTHPNMAGTALGIHGLSGEFSSEMEAHETRKLEAAKAKTIDTIAELRQNMQLREKELLALKNELEELSKVP